MALITLATASKLAAQKRSAPISDIEIKLSFAPIVRKTGPAVVNIFARRKVVKQQQGWMFNDPFFRRFFSDQLPFGGGGRNRRRVENSLGSGVIVGADGIIVTNNHVIKDANDIKVVLSDRREFDATLLLKDKRTDIAVLRVDLKGEELPTVAFSDSNDLEVGDLVLALGNPFGVGRTVTSGIVSAVARTTVGITDYRFFIQTDAAINPGNSGGALVDMSGQLVGINTAIYSRNGGSLGIGFAVPSNMVRVIVSSAVSGKPLVRPWVSFVGKSVTSDIANAIGLERPFGVIVEEVIEGGPAANAGLRPGDVILRLGRHEIEDAQALRFRLAIRSLGER
jgi:serine protease Do